VILDYAEGIKAIDWSLIAQRDYNDRVCKVTCMAECLSPNSVSADKMFAIYVKTEADEKAVQELTKEHGISCFVNLMPTMFASDAHV